MSIEQALGRYPIERQRTVVDEFGSNKEGKAVLAKVNLLLREAHIPEALRQLAEIIRPSFPDVKISKKEFLSGGGMCTGIEWNFRNRPSQGRYDFHSINISVLPTREEIVIGTEVLTRKKWVTNRAIVEDAIVAAYKNPRKSNGPRGMM